MPACTSASSSSSPGSPRPSAGSRPTSEARARAADRRVQIERSLTRDRSAVRARAGAPRRSSRSSTTTSPSSAAARARRCAGLTDCARDRSRARAEAERTLDEIRQKSHRAEIEEAEAKLRLETSIETLRRDLDIEPAGGRGGAEQPELPEGATAAGRVRELDRELRLLGPINPLALEEFNELQQRHTFLEEQLEDVRSTRRDLSRVIKAVDQEIQNVFAGAFADVSMNFTQLFGTLFPGGVGQLKLTAPDDLLNTGHRGRGQAERQERQEAVAAVGWRAQPHGARRSCSPCSAAGRRRST